MFGRQTPKDFRECADLNPQVEMVGEGGKVLMRDVRGTPRRKKTVGKTWAPVELADKAVHLTDALNIHGALSL